jgi:hypothetical protein
MKMDIININTESSVKNIQVQFNSLYPFLKIEFLKSMASFINSGIININSKRTVAEIENEFKEKIGVPIQVFRKSGNVWIETTLTDDWTLEQQNKEGEQISSHFSERLHKNQPNN